MVVVVVVLVVVMLAFSRGRKDHLSSGSNNFVLVRTVTAANSSTLSDGQNRTRNKLT
jgi:hypothetical protein